MALLIPDLSNPVYTRIIRGAYQQARTHGYVVLLAEDTADHEADESYAQLVETGRVDGLLIASARPAHPLVRSPRLATVPHVFVNREVPGSGRNIGMDLRAASATAVRHLYELGHRRIGHVSGPEELEPARARERGFVDEMIALGLDSSGIERDSFSERGGADAALRLLERAPDVTALYASTLSQAIGVMHTARSLDRHIPADLSVMTYDDLPLADYLDPPLTTVAMPLVELGSAAVEALVHQLRGGLPTDVVVATPPVVVTRNSTASPAKQRRRARPQGPTH
jgi:DNA-binding LacI/PurR family transcriptional regulator